MSVFATWAPPLVRFDAGPWLRSAGVDTQEGPTKLRVKRCLPSLTRGASVPKGPNSTSGWPLSSSSAVHVRPCRVHHGDAGSQTMRGVRLTSLLESEILLYVGRGTARCEALCTSFAVGNTSAALE